MKLLLETSKKQIQHKDEGKEKTARVKESKDKEYYRYQCEIDDRYKTRKRDTKE